MAKITFDTNDSERVLVQLRTLIDMLIKMSNTNATLNDIDEETDAAWHKREALSKQQTDTASNEEIIPEAFEPPAPRQTRTAITPETTNADRPDVDLKGVAFNGTYCGRAKEPFYGTTKRKGQWKKRQGVDEADYDNWYARELAKVNNDALANTQAAFSPASVVTDTRAAFSPQQQQTQQEPLITDFATLYSWISKLQTDKVITQIDMGQAYINAGISDAQQAIQDIIRLQSENPPAAQELISRIHQSMLHILESKKR